MPMPIALDPGSSIGMGGSSSVAADAILRMGHLEFRRSSASTWQRSASILPGIACGAQQPCAHGKMLRRASRFGDGEPRSSSPRVVSNTTNRVLFRCWTG